jgi:hypothetical protein
MTNVRVKGGDIARRVPRIATPPEAGDVKGVRASGGLPLSFFVPSFAGVLSKF